MNGFNGLDRSRQSAYPPRPYIHCTNCNSHPLRASFLVVVYTVVTLCTMVGLVGCVAGSSVSALITVFEVNMGLVRFSCHTRPESEIFSISNRYHSC